MDSKIWKESYNSFLQFLHCKLGTQNSVPQPKHDLRKKEESNTILSYSSVIINQHLYLILILISLIMFILLLKVLVGVSATEDTIQHIEAII